MSVMKRRTRLVTFRVSSEEYEILKQSCLDSECRSISEFARGAILKRIGASRAAHGLLSEDLSTVAAELAELEAALTNLRTRIRRVLGSVQEEREIPPLKQCS